MFRRPSKKQQLIQRIIVYAVMVVSVLVIVTGIVLFILGYRLDSNNGRLAQGSLVQFESIPTNGDVFIDDEYSGDRTNTKKTVVAGIHNFRIERTGYETWQKTLTLSPGTLTWLDYARLVPKELPTEAVLSYDTLHAAKASPDFKKILTQEAADTPTFNLVDISDREVRSSSVTIAPTAYREATTEGVSHRFTLDAWDQGGRYMLVKHAYDDAQEWLVLDTQDASRTVNVSRLFSISLADLQFSGTSGKILYGLSNGVIRKIDLSSETISRGYASNVTSFSMFETNLLTYLGTADDGSKKQVAGVYRDGDEAGHIIQTATSADNTLAIDVTRYFNDLYLAVADGLEVTVYTGNLPSSSDDPVEDLTIATEFMVAASVDSLSFSPTGDYLVVRSGLSMVSYEIEHERETRSEITTSEGKAHSFYWLDDAYLWAIYDGHLSIREFDGTNVHVIMPMEPGFDATLSQNGRYIYGVNKSEDGKSYQLQRVTMILG
jgi:hypothetical protein